MQSTLTTWPFYFTWFNIHIFFEWTIIFGNQQNDYIFKWLACDGEKDHEVYYDIRLRASSHLNEQVTPNCTQCVMMHSM